MSHSYKTILVDTVALISPLVGVPLRRLPSYLVSVIVTSDDERHRAWNFLWQLPLNIKYMSSNSLSMFLARQISEKTFSSLFLYIEILIFTVSVTNDHAGEFFFNTFISRIV